jgi:hypothetical protein
MPEREHRPPQKHHRRRRRGRPSAFQQAISTLGWIIAVSAILVLGISILGSLHDIEFVAVKGW